MKKRKIGIFFILIGIAIPSVMFFFAEHELYSIRNNKKVSRRLTPAEIETVKMKFLEEKRWMVDLSDLFSDRKLGTNTVRKEFSEKDKWMNENWTVEYSIIIKIQYRIFLGIGVLLSFIGIGFVTFSFFPKTKE